MTATSKIRSMTGFATAEGDVAGSRVRVEIRTLNHRFLDLKIRLPRELSAADVLLRPHLQSRLSRGAVELRAEVFHDPEKAVESYEADLPLASRLHSLMTEIQKELGLKDPIRTADLTAFPEVISRKGGDGLREAGAEEVWKPLRPLVDRAVDGLIAMRAREGDTLAEALTRTVAAIREGAGTIRSLRGSWEQKHRDRIRTRITEVFEAHPIGENGVREVLESRIAQELSLILDRTDIEEELTRLEGHLEHLEGVLAGGSPAGRKLDFLLQEVNRETNTIGNKAQDYGISEEVVRLKIAVEQLREQAMNIE